MLGLKCTTNRLEILFPTVLEVLFGVIGYSHLHIKNCSLEKAFVSEDLKSTVIVPVAKVSEPKA